jgi:hypothetical protein
MSQIEYELALPKIYSKQQALTAWPMILPCPVSHPTVFDSIFTGREKEDFGKSSEASADQFDFPLCLSPTGLTLSREREPPPRHLIL